MASQAPLEELVKDWLDLDFVRSASVCRCDCSLEFC